MGRKDAARFKKIEDRITKLEDLLRVQIEDHGRFVSASKRHWQSLRDVLTKIIEWD